MPRPAQQLPGQWWPSRIISERSQRAVGLNALLPPVVLVKDAQLVAALRKNAELAVLQKVEKGRLAGCSSIPGGKLEIGDHDPAIGTIKQRRGVGMGDQSENANPVRRHAGAV